MTTGKTIALTRWTFVGKVMSLLFNMFSRLVITFLSRSKCLLISWLQSPSSMILEPPQNKVWYYFHCFPIYFPWSERCSHNKKVSMPLTSSRKVVSEVLSCFSCVWLIATPWTVAHQAILSIGFSRQEYRRGCQFPLQISEVHEAKCWVWRFLQIQFPKTRKAEKTNNGVFEQWMLFSFSHKGV